MQVYVAHSMSLVVSTLTTCLQAEGTPGEGKQASDLKMHARPSTPHNVSQLSSYWWRQDCGKILEMSLKTITLGEVDEGRRPPSSLVPAILPLPSHMRDLPAHWQGPGACV